jgi:hypothetical protein
MLADQTAGSGGSAPLQQHPSGESNNYPINDPVSNDSADSGELHLVKNLFLTNHFKYNKKMTA